MSDTAEQISASIDSLTREFEIITHNLANASTAGYKRRSNSFSKILEQQSSQIASADEVTQIFDFSQGNIVETGRNLDFALHGEGFFVIETPDGPLYTRNGAFTTNSNGQIVDFQGRTVAGQNGPISIPNSIGLSQLEVSVDGIITAEGTSIERFKLVDFGEDNDKLVSVGGNCFRMSDEDIDPSDAVNVAVKQGFQESSNVKIVEELVDLIMVTRLYESNMEYLSATKDTTNSLISLAMG